MSFQKAGAGIVRVRPLQRHEIGAVARVIEETSEAQLSNRWQEQELGFRELLVGEQDGALVATVSIRHNAAAETMHLFALEVASGLRGRGIGAQMVDYVVGEARRRRCTRVYLEVRTDNPARRLYHRLGFRRVGASFINAWWRFNDNGTRDRLEEPSYRMVKRLY